MPRSGGDRWFNTKHEVSDQGSYLDPSDVKAVREQAVIDFYHIGTKNSIAFKAFIVSYSDSYQVNYGPDPIENAKKLYGGDLTRPISTTRTISLSWKTVAASAAEAKENMQRISELAQMLYNGKSQDSVNSGDGKGGELKVRFAQWIVDPSKVDPKNPGQFAPADHTGLHCRMSTLSYDPDLEQGSFDGPSGIFPKVINLTTTFIHQPAEEGKKLKLLHQNKKGAPKLPVGVGKTMQYSSKKLSGLPFGYKGLESSRSDAPPTVNELNNGSDDEFDAMIEDELTQGGG
jgi:hypothetical protein